MEPKISNLQSEINNKQKRKLFGRSDRFLRQDFGKDIAKKIKSISNSENPASLITSNSEIGKKTEFEPFIEEKQLQKVLKNKRYEIKFGDLRVETFINSLKLSDQQNFLSVPRKPCPLCKRNSCLYCPECLQPVIYESLIPKVLLPIQLTLLWHQQEKKSKSSALPLKLLVEPAIKIVPFPESEIDFDMKSTVFLYPHKNSKKISEFTLQELEEIKNVVAIECTWNQTNGILKELKNTEKNYKYIRLADYETFFWRHQKHAEKCLATCEAIYYFFKEYEQALAEAKGGKEIYAYDGKFDNLLFYFTLQFKTILSNI